MWAIPSMYFTASPDLHPPALSAADGLWVHFRPGAGTVRPSGSQGERYDWFR